MIRKDYNDQIYRTEPEKYNAITDKIIEFEVYNKKQKIIVSFVPKTFDILGWKTTDIFQNNVEFTTYNVKKNVMIKKGKFKIPKIN